MDHIVIARFRMSRNWLLVLPSILLGAALDHKYRIHVRLTPDAASPYLGFGSRSYAFFARQATQLAQCSPLVVLIEDANVRALGRHKVHNALIRSLRVRALIDDFANASAGRDDKTHG